MRLLRSTPTIYRMAYDVVCNATLWFVHHGLFDLARRPRFDRRFAEAWAAYRAGEPGLRRRRGRRRPRRRGRAGAGLPPHPAGPDAGRPAARPAHGALQPHAVRRARPDPGAARRRRPAELLEGMAGHHACGFHTRRWADAFAASCRRGDRPRRRRRSSPRWPPTPTTSAPSPSSPACDAALAELDAAVGDRRLIVRVDRIELSKNLLRGFHAFDDLLERYPEWRERVVFGAFVYPSREGLPEYLAYRQEVEAVIDAINERWATPAWTPILVDLSDDFPRSVAALRRYDVLLVNPIRDGLNLVAKEGAAGQRARRPGGAQPRGRGVGRAGRGRAPGAPLRHRRHRRRAGRGAGRRPGRAGHRGGGAARAGPGPHPRGLAGRPARRRRLRPGHGTGARRGGAARAPRRSGQRSLGAVDHEIGPVQQLDAAPSALRTATRTVATPPAAASRSRASNAGQVADVVADEAHRAEAVGQLEQRGALVDARSAGAARSDIRAGRSSRPERAACCSAHARTSASRSGRPR